MRKFLKSSWTLFCGIAIAFTAQIALPPPASCAEALPHAAPSTNEDGKIHPLPTQSLTITSRDGVTHRFTVEVAVKSADQARGLMFRKSLAADHGMLFIWPAPRNSIMWMRNTYIPLDIVFIDASHKIAAIAENTVPLSEALIRGHGASVAVLELPAMTTAKSGIRVGDKLAYDGFKGQKP
ncbi:DUF192 domain-containing protein [Candidatus Kirkpatrickella diaphorinae]|uniref:DUF192 domain-containing protein n=1 Tax=Candidatus Kirkpatrickella diaphorinae TaxID=2984322 RepID=A0ABY6GKT6_9PROT|nr:DUF192 domain-containing protein [Candidatus Kirkpatrickella diaphorinae]UYH51358.1 DUF192 domain-containing protein [Candidatus Kirkpatrickella diaphorinae]